MGKLAAVWLALFLTMAPAGLAQKNKEPTTRRVTGVVTAPDGSIVVGAVVQLTDNKTKNVRSFYTQGKGDYYFNGLSPDVEYELIATYKGASSKTKTLSIFDTRKEAHIDLKIEPPKQ